MAEGDGFTAAAGLKSAAGFGAIGLSLSAAYALTGVGVPCPFRYLTHLLCPLCGSTTMGAALLRGDLGSAWTANPLVLLLLCGLGVACICWSVELVGGPAVRPPHQLAGRRTWLVILGTVALGFAVFRNLAAGA